jgi:hypothetical protein
VSFGKTDSVRKQFGNNAACVGKASCCLLTPVEGELGVFDFGRDMQVRLTIRPRINGRATKKRKKKKKGTLASEPSGNLATRLAQAWYWSHWLLHFGWQISS